MSSPPALTESNRLASASAARLLVLDDDETVGMTLTLGAQACGVEARWCASLDSFMQALEAWSPTHLAVDLQLPDATVDLVFQRLAASGSQAQVIICSGAGASDQDAAMALARNRGLAVLGRLPKPFRLTQLRALLGGSGPQA